MTKRKSFTRAFKLEAVRLLESGEKKAADLARELEVPRNPYKWQEHGMIASMSKKGAKRAIVTTTPLPRVSSAT